MSSEEDKGTGGVYGRLTNYGDLGFSKFIRRAFLSSAGLDSGDIDRPVVGIVGGCDKTVPAELMAAASADIPAIQLVVGPMTVGSYQGERLGACTDCRRMWTEFRSGRLGEQELAEINAQLAPSAGTCMVMGTASTMACVVEAMGMSLPLAGTAPSVSADRLRISTATGRQAVELARSGRKPSEIMTEGGIQERDRGPGRDRRIDQRDHPPHRDRPPPGARHRPR